MSISGNPNAKPPVVMIAGIFLATFIALVAIAVFYSTSQDRQEQEALELIRQSQVASCERVNTLSRETNKAIDVLQRHLEITADTWQELAKISDDPREVGIELQAAAGYREMIGRLNPVEIPECNEVVPQYQNIREVVDRD